MIFTKERRFSSFSPEIMVSWGDGFSKLQNGQPLGLSSVFDSLLGFPFTTQDRQNQFVAVRGLMQRGFKMYPLSLGWVVPKY